MLKWEEIKQDTAGTLQRTKVPNGWLVREVQEVFTPISPEYNILSCNGYTWTTSITFVPDINHEWEIE